MQCHLGTCFTWKLCWNHPSHFPSKHWLINLQGDCFTCHTQHLKLYHVARIGSGHTTQTPQGLNLCRVEPPGAELWPPSLSKKPKNHAGSTWLGFEQACSASTLLLSWKRHGLPNVSPLFWLFNSSNELKSYLSRIYHLDSGWCPWCLTPGIYLLPVPTDSPQRGIGTATLKHHLLMDKLLPTSSFMVELPYPPPIWITSFKVHPSHLLSPHSCGPIKMPYTTPFSWIPAKSFHFPPINPLNI